MARPNFIQSRPGPAAWASGGVTTPTQLAMRLIDDLGVEPALDICDRNCWAGVRNAILTATGTERRRAR